MTQQAVKAPPFREIKDGRLRLNLHSGQTRTHLSKNRKVAMLAGSQGGKTAYGVHWLDREIRTQGPGDYLIGTASFPLLTRKLLPEFLYVFMDLYHYGTYNSYEKIFTFFQEDTVRKKTDVILFPDADVRTRVLIGSAQNPESLESATVKGVWLDECGQKQFKRETWEAVERRTLINQARILLTTTLYGLGWLKTEIYDPWLKCQKGEEGGDPDIDVIQFDSTDNPSFPIEEYERMKATMPSWKFDLFHRGRFSRPAGIIYNAFDSATQIIPPFDIPNNWPRYVGHDFGPTHTVALWAAMNPATQELFIYREYVMGGLSTFEHVTNWIELSKGERIDSRYGGSNTEDGWRGDFTQAGWRIDKPLISSVEAGIQKVYGYEKLGKKKVFSTCQNYISEKQSYSRELDDMYNATDKIENKSIYHLMDCLIAGTLITTEEGLKPIEDIKIGEKVLTRQGYFPVVDTIKKFAETVKVTFSDGSALRGTPNHSVFVKGKGFVPLNTLRYNDIIEVWNETQLPTMGLHTTDTPKPAVKRIGHILDLGANFFIELFGKITMGRFLKDFISTIKTEILSIMTYPILRLCPSPNTRMDTTKGDHTIMNIFGRYEFWQRAGIALQKADSGIENTAKGFGRIDSQFLRYVSNVGKSIKRLNLLIASSAPQRVRQQTDVLEEKITKPANVLFAERTLPLIDIQKPKPAHGNVVRCLGVSPSGKTLVYDLSVGTVHEYYANGILVHNSERYLISQFNPVGTLSGPTELAPVARVV